MASFLPDLLGLKRHELPGLSWKLIAALAGSPQPFNHLCDRLWEAEVITQLLQPVLLLPVQRKNWKCRGYHTDSTSTFISCFESWQRQSIARTTGQNRWGITLHCWPPGRWIYVGSLGHMWISFWPVPHQSNPGWYFVTMWPWTLSTFWCILSIL